MKNVAKEALQSGIKLATFSGLIVALTAFTNSVTTDRIELERKKSFERILREVAGKEIVQLTALPDEIYMATSNNGDTGFIVPAITQQGYNGEIKMWVGVDQTGTITGVRVIEHRETPGLGDKIMLQVSDWIMGFNGKSLQNPTADGWRVRKDGGDFDHFTGATITPRAVVQAVHYALVNLKSRSDQEKLP
jgi:electron transport complex protein RnfG